MNEAAKWYRSAAEQGQAEAQALLGSMYTQGDGVAKDKAEAEKWFKLAAKQGNQLAEKNLKALNVK